METIKELFDLTGKVALVTGGTHGIGLAIGLILGKAGARVCVNDLSSEKLALCREAFGKEGLSVYTLVFDVTDEKDVDRGISQIEADEGPVEILVNNAGIIKRIPILNMPVEDYKQVIDVDLVAPFIVSRRVAPGYDSKAKRKDNQHVFHDERLRTEYSVGICFSKGRSCASYKEHDMRMGKIQHSD